MAEIPNLIEDLALILVVAGIVTLVFKKLKQPLVLGYIVAGFLVSPHMPYIMSVVDKGDIHTWADIGVMFLLFSLGLDFSFKKILKMGMAPVIAALTIIFSMMTLGILVGHSFGWNRMDCIFLGGMLAMSSTTIIYKAFDDLGLRQQRFASLVMSVLILEDVLAIVMMVMLSAIASGNNPDGGEMLGSILKIGFFLVLWFVVGIFLIPLFFRKTRKLMNSETMVIVALGLCCLMAVLSTKVGFSSAFGAFVMGSIIAETVEADKIIKLVEPVKNLFGAIFFVSVGMLVEPKVLVDYAIPILVLVLTILLGQGIFGTAGFMLSGQSLKNAMRCGFSMAQIGEFAFIIASLGLSLGVIGKFLYPVVVAVSVITTFLTPYMIRFAEPCYNHIEKHLPKKWVRRMNHVGNAHQNSTEEENAWKVLLRKMLINTAIYGILSTAVVTLMLTFVLPLCRNMLGHWPGNAVCGLLTVLMISPFLRSMVMKNVHSDEFRQLWTESLLNRLPLIFTMIVRVAIAAMFIFYIVNYLTRFKEALMITIAGVALVAMVLSRRLKHRSIKLERLFIKNLRSREIAEQVNGERRPLFEGRLLDRDIHIGDFDIPEDSTWIGRTLKDLQFRNRFGVHVSSILRGSLRINIPNGRQIIFPGDRISVIGSDEQLKNFSQAIANELIPEDPEIEKREMKLRKFILSDGTPFIGKTLAESGIRDRYGCMVVGVEEGQENLTLVDPQRKFEKGDIIWLVGEEADLEKVRQQISVLTTTSASSS
ncbi:MAG: cation:proton antiporter [Segatella oris]